MRSRKVEPKVRVFLKNYPSLRDSDKELLLAFWAGEGLHLTNEQRQAFLNSTPAESITRARRSLRSVYPGSKAVEESRYERFIEETDDHSDGKALAWMYDDD